MNSDSNVNARILSFDIGIKHLAYCMIDINTETNIPTIIDWNVLDISREKKEPMESKICCFVNKLKKKKEKIEICKPCTKPAKFYKDTLFLCEKHAKISDFLMPKKEMSLPYLKKSSLDKIDQLAQQYSFSWEVREKKMNKNEKVQLFYDFLLKQSLHKIEDDSNSEKKTNQLDLVEIGRNMVTHLDPMISNLNLVTQVVIENQISPIANRMKTIQGMLAQYFIIHKVQHIEFISSLNKLKEYLGDSETNYKKNKKNGIVICRKWLDEPFFDKWILFFESHPQKKDDLADSFLQGIWFIRNKIIKNADNLKINNVVLT